MAELSKPREMKVVAIIQARMGSSRLPGKVLKDICGSPMLDWVVTRVRRARFIDTVMVATTVAVDDDPIVQWCGQNSVSCFRGAEMDVLDRFYRAAVSQNADVIVRITADCPLVDPGVIDAVLERFFGEGADFCANRLPAPYPRTYPIGLDVEVVSFAALESAWREADQTFEREHVLPYLYAEEGRFKVTILDAEQDHGSLRWTVDTQQDLEFVRQLTASMQCDRSAGWLEILEFLQTHPELTQINASVHHKVFTDVDQRAENGEKVENG